MPPTEIHATGLGPRLLERCARLAGPAATVDTSGHVTGLSVQGPALSTLLRCSRVVSSIMVCSVRGEGHAAEFELIPGLRLVVVTYRNEDGRECRLGAMLAGPEVAGSAGFRDLCAAGGVDATEAARELAPYARFDAQSAAFAREALAAAALDLAVLHDSASALDGFTRQLSESYDTIDLLYSLGRSMHEPFQPERFLDAVATRLHATMSFGWLAVVTGPAPTAVTLRGRLIAKGTLPLPPAEFRRAAERITHTGSAAGVLQGVEGLTKDASPQLLVQAIHCKGLPIGFVLAGGKFGDDPMISSYDLQLVEATSGYLSAFADNVALYEEQHNLFMGTLHALTAAIDAKDRYTCGHSERVAWLARALALASGMTPEQAERVYLAGIVHDVGKIGVPEAVLGKPGRLTEAEFALIKRHPQIGHRILKDIAQFADMLPGVLHHHERWDGRGYPHGLRGAKIPLSARIIAVADTFDAMSSNRAYRPAMGREQVLAEIERSAGTQLDADIARLVRGLDLREFDRLLAGHAAQAISQGTTPVAPASPKAA